MDGSDGFDPEIPCSHCDAAVLYSEWDSADSVDGETECVKCPECGYVAGLDELFD